GMLTSEREVVYRGSALWPAPVELRADLFDQPLIDHRIPDALHVRAWQGFCGLPDLVVVCRAALPDAMVVAVAVRQVVAINFLFEFFERHFEFSLKSGGLAVRR